MGVRREGLLGSLQRFTEFFPFLDQTGMIRFVLLEFVRLALALFCADEILQRGFQVSDGSFRAADIRFQIADAIFNLLTLDGIESLLGFSRAVAV